MLPDALAECARPRACSPRTVSEWTKVGLVDANMCASIGLTGDRRSAISLRRTAFALRHSRRLCAATGTQPRHEDCAIKKCSARLLTDPQERLPAKVEYALRANTWVLACVRLWLHHRSWLPVFHPVSGTKHGRPFREIDGRTLLAPALTSCRARLWFWTVCRPFEPCSYARSRERKIGGIRCRNGSQGA